MIYEDFVVNELKQYLPDLIEKEKLDPIKYYITDQPYYINEFPSYETTPVLSVYRVKDEPSDVGWDRQLSIDLYVYYEKDDFNATNRSIDGYERIIVPTVQKHCSHLDIIEITFPTYLDTGNFYLKGFQILAEARGYDITRRFS